MKVCPKCKRTWPDMGRFCPMDGTGLEPVRVPVAPPPPPVTLAPLEDPQEKPTDRVPAARPRKTASTSKQPAARKAAPKKAGTFSETGWFVAGAKVPEDEMAAVELPPEQLDEKYRATKELPEEVRKKYSLRYGTPEDEPGRK